jgi:hypothetical protein
LRPPAVLVPRSAQACGRSRALTGGDSMPILGFHPQRKEVIQCLTPSAVTSLGSPAKPSWAWQTGRSQRLDQRVQKIGRDGSIPPRLSSRLAELRSTTLYPSTYHPPSPARWAFAGEIVLCLSHAPPSSGLRHTLLRPAGCDRSNSGRSVDPSDLPPLSCVSACHRAFPRRWGRSSCGQHQEAETGQHPAC